MLKVNGFIVTNVGLLANSSNYKVMFPELLRKIPRMSVTKYSKDIPGILL